MPADGTLNSLCKLPLKCRYHVIHDVDDGQGNAVGCSQGWAPDSDLIPFAVTATYEALRTATALLCFLTSLSADFLRGLGFPKAQNRMNSTAAIQQYQRISQVIMGLDQCCCNTPFPLDQMFVPSSYPGSHKLCGSFLYHLLISFHLPPYSIRSRICSIRPCSPRLDYCNSIS